MNTCPSLSKHGKMEPARLFEGRPDSTAIQEAVRHAVAKVGDTHERVSKSQVAFYEKRAFAATSVPGQYLKGKRPPLVLSIYLRRRDPSPRWKQVVEPTPGRFTHHIELHSPSDVDAFVTEILCEAWAAAS